MDDTDGKAALNKTQHEMFVQLSELDEENVFWVEKSRWIKYEEDKEEGAERWGKPHLSSLTFHSMTSLRLCLEKSITLLDCKEINDFSSVAKMIVEECNKRGYITDKNKQSDLLRLLSNSHKFVESSTRKTSEAGFRGNFKRSLSKMSNPGSRSSHEKSNDDHKVEGILNEGFGIDMKGMSDDKKASAPMNNEVMSHHNGKEFKIHGNIACLSNVTEGTITLVGTWEKITEPLCVFVRLSDGILFPEVMEVPVPVRFVFLLLTPPSKPSMSYINPHEVGRSFSTMMNDPTFYHYCYQISAREQLITAFDEFLDSSVVLPSRDTVSKNLISLREIHNIVSNDQSMKESAKQAIAEQTKTPSTAKLEVAADTVDLGDNQTKTKYDPLKRGRYPFHGVYNDLKNRFRHYTSDITDALNGQCVAATVFIYFAALSGAVTFGGLTGDATNNQIGVPETLITSAIAGIMFALLSAQPLIITGLTGPILLYDQSLYNFAQTMEVDFLQWRVWIGVWLLIISIFVAGFQGSVLVRFFSRFTKDIFASLVSLLFIFSALQKLMDEFKAHPLKSKTEYCNVRTNDSKNDYDLEKSTEKKIDISDDDHSDHGYENEPNTALLSLLLMFGTFLIAYGLKIFRNGIYMGRTIRRALGDFGVPIAIVLMVAVDYSINDTYTKKLKVPFGLQTTMEGRGWLIDPLMSNLTLKLQNGTEITGPRYVPMWLPFVSIIPGFLLFLLLFIETEICELLIMEKSNKKGGGLHWDIVLLCVINACAAVFGGPWICAATVRGVAHVSALTTMSTNNAPGEAPHIVDVKEQRVSALMVSLLCGFSLLLASALEQIPFAVLYGVFLYMGVSGVNAIQLFDRIQLMLMPVKHHPRVGYTCRVRTLKMHMFTLVQLGGLGVLWAVKSIPSIALAFPFFVAAMVGVRWSLKFLFTEKELDNLDGPDAGKKLNDEEDEPDFYAAGIGG